MARVISSFTLPKPLIGIAVGSLFFLFYALLVPTSHLPGTGLVMRGGPGEITGVCVSLPSSFRGLQGSAMAAHHVPTGKLANGFLCVFVPWQSSLNFTDKTLCEE